MNPEELRRWAIEMAVRAHPESLIETAEAIVAFASPQSPAPALALEPEQRRNGRWTPERVAYLHEARDAGLTHKQIAYVLNRSGEVFFTNSAVAAQCRKIGIPYRTGSPKQVAHLAKMRDLRSQRLSAERRRDKIAALAGQDT